MRRDLPVLSAVLAFLLCACGSSTIFPRTDGGGGGARDLSISFTEDGGMPPPECDNAHPCPVGKQCMNGKCVEAGPPCTSDDECQDDTYCACLGGGGGDAGPCMDGHCQPWGTGPQPFDPDCRGQAFLATDFKAPVVKCSWKDTMGQNSNVIMTPLVADLDKNGKPEIVFATYGTGLLIAIRGDTCQEIWRKNLPITGRSQLAAADLDGDGFPEIIVPGNNQILVLDRNGNQLAAGGTVTGGFPGGTCGGVAIADTDGNGVPEFAFHGAMLRYQNKQVTELWSKPFTGGTWGTATLMADMDGDGKPEAVTGMAVYDGITGNDETPAALKAMGTDGGYPAIADFNKDGKPDIAMVQSKSGAQKFFIFDYANNKVIFGPYTVGNGGGWGGTPTIGDYDGDGVPDVGFASQSFYYVYALKCAQNPKPKDCTGTDQGVLWQRGTRDQSSGGTGSSTFDFNGDGKAEVAYRDECWFRVYNGADGKTVFAQPITSGTLLEYPVIADVDADGHADIIVPTDSLIGQGCANVAEGQLPDKHTGATAGIIVLQDPMNRWMPSRPLWHQHTYHITEIGDDYKVPKQEMPNWLTWNNYRKNVQGMAGKGGALPDFTGGTTTQIDNGGMDCKASERLWANLCNRGSNTAGPGIPGTFYESDPRIQGAKAICTTRTTQMLSPGQCESVYCDRANPPDGPQDLWFRADDDGMKANQVLECKQKNDLLFLPQYMCKTIG